MSLDCPLPPPNCLGLAPPSFYDKGDDDDHRACNLLITIAMMMMTTQVLVIFVPGDLTLECEEDAERYQLKIEESLQVDLLSIVMMMAMMMIMNIMMIGNTLRRF